MILWRRLPLKKRLGRIFKNYILIADKIQHLLGVFLNLLAAFCASLLRFPGFISHADSALSGTAATSHAKDSRIIHAVFQNPYFKGMRGRSKKNPWQFC
jgi:hypothetical protein